MGREHLFMYPGYGDGPEGDGASSAGSAEVPDPRAVTPSFTGAVLHPFERMIVVEPIEGEPSKDFHDRRRAAAVEAGHALYERTHGKKLRPGPES